MANRTIRTSKREAAFLDALRQGASITMAAKAAKIGRRTAYEWRDEDAAFASAWDAAVEEGTDRLEDEMVRRAVEGTDKPVFYKGTACGYVREYSDTLLIFALKARRPDKFKDRVANEHSGPGGAPIEVTEIRRVIVDPKAGDGGA